jgi:hypothetical protein
MGSLGKINVMLLQDICLWRSLTPVNKLIEIAEMSIEIAYLTILLRQFNTSFRPQRSGEPESGKSLTINGFRAFATPPVGIHRCFNGYLDGSVHYIKFGSCFISGKRVKSSPLHFSKVRPIAQSNRGLETAVSKEVSYPLHSIQLLHRRLPNVVRFR